MIAGFTMIGRLGADAEIRYAATGTPIAKMRVATTRWSKRDNAEETHWFTVQAAVSDKLTPYLTKGQLVYLAGDISTSKTDEKWYTNYFAHTVKLLGGSKGAGQDAAPAKVAVPSKDDGTSAPITDDDLPF